MTQQQAEELCRRWPTPESAKAGVAVKVHIYPYDNGVNVAFVNAFNVKMEIGDYDTASTLMEGMTFTEKVR